ncbi:MAG: bacillithiol biosynthesis protein BshC [Candidatus Thorarchaeota archaeon]
MKPSVTEVYQEFIWSIGSQELASKLYDNPPITLGGLHENIPSLLEHYKSIGWHSEYRLQQIRKTLTRVNRRLGWLTPKVKKNIEILTQGAVEAAHQSVVIGGPSFILNKAVTAERIAALNSTEENPLAPFYCIADYDIVQNELTHMRTPLMGSGGNLISIPVPKGYEYSPVSVIPLPEYAWYEKVEDDIRQGYRAIFKVLEGNTRTLFDERLEYSMKVLKSGFVNSSTLGEWAQYIIGRLINIEGDLGIPILPASDTEIRALWALGMELLLKEDVHEKFLKVHAEATEIITSSAYETGAGSRGANYVPFYYECPEESCNRSRTELSYKIDGSNILLEGKCPTCGQILQIETSRNDPTLQQHSKFLSPRVDTRQLIIDTTLPIVAHVGGPGETAYYAQVIPIAKELEYPFPMFVKYPRVFFNTPWNEDLAKLLKERELPVLHGSDLFRPMGKVSRFRKKGRFEEMNEMLQELSNFISQSYTELNKSLDGMTSEISATEGKVSEDKLQEKLDLERYLSWTFGQYAVNKRAQESSWSWIEWVCNSGFSDIFGPYIRAYVPEMKNGATLFVNFSV